MVVRLLNSSSKRQLEGIDGAYHNGTFVLISPQRLKAQGNRSRKCTYNQNQPNHSRKNSQNKYYLAFLC